MVLKGGYLSSMLMADKIVAMAAKRQLPNIFGPSLGACIILVLLSSLEV